MITANHLVYDLLSRGIYFVRSEDPHTYPPLNDLQLLAGLARYDEGRLNSALIVLLFHQPELAACLPAALRRLWRKTQRDRLKLYYTAAFILQDLYPTEIACHWPAFQRLTDLFSAELGLAAGLPPEQRLQALAVQHARLTGFKINWAADYQDTMHNMFRFRERSKRWKK